MTTTRPKGPEPEHSDRPPADVLAAIYLRQVVSYLGKFSDVGDALRPLLGAIDIIGSSRRRPEPLDNRQRAILIGLIDSAEGGAFEYLTSFDGGVLENGFAALRHTVDEWSRPQLSSQERDIVGQAETRRRADADLHRWIFRDAVHTAVLRREMASTPATARVAAERRAGARPAAAAPQPDHSYEPTVVRIAERFERVARGDDPIDSAVLALRDLIALFGEREDTVLGPELPSAAALNRLGDAMSAAVFPLAKAAGHAVVSDHVALGLGCADALLAREFSPTAVSIEWTPQRLACMRGHLRLLAAELDALQQRRAIDAAGNVVFRGALAAHLMQRAEPAGAVFH